MATAGGQRPDGFGGWMLGLWREFRAGAQRGHARARCETSADARVDEASDESFPASDAPGVRLPDEPPANADAKWAAAEADARRRGVDEPTRNADS
jgi:hypothetical protein